jgi:hypothetical protein
VGRAFAYCLEGEAWRRLAIGGLVNAVPVVGACWASGYALAVMRRAAGGEDDLPEWRGWGRLFVEGLAYYVIPTVYLFPALALFAVATGIGLVGLADRLLGLGLATTNGGLLLGLVAGGLVLALLGAYPIPAALWAFARTGRYGPAFRLPALLAMVRPHRRAYHIALLWSAVSFLAALAWQLTLQAHLVGLIAIPFLGFYLQLVWAHLCAQVLSRTKDE